MKAIKISVNTVDVWTAHRNRNVPRMEHSLLTSTRYGALVITGNTKYSIWNVSKCLITTKQRAMPVIVSRFAGRTWKNNSKWRTLLPRLYWNFYSTHTIYKCSRGLDSWTKYSLTSFKILKNLQAVWIIYFFLHELPLCPFCSQSLPYMYLNTAYN